MTDPLDAVFISPVVVTPIGNEAYVLPGERVMIVVTRNGERRNKAFTVDMLREYAADETLGDEAREMCLRLIDAASRSEKK